MGGGATYTGTEGKPLGTDQGHVCLRWPHGPALNVALIPGLASQNRIPTVRRLVWVCLQVYLLECWGPVSDHT